MDSPTRRTIVRESLAAGLIGAGILTLLAATGFVHLTWPDETVYAVVGRNIAAGKGPISNFYVPRSIIAAGVPLGDVHMPGHAFTLALSFLLLGPREYAAFLPNQVSFVIGGVLLFALGRVLFGRAVALMAALFFYACPPLGAYANTTMSEPTLVALSVLFLALWCRALHRPRRMDAFVLALVLGAGATHHETFLILAPAVLYALWRWPSERRARGIWIFLLTLSTCVILVVWPLYRGRAPYPHWTSALFETGREGDLLRTVASNALQNVRTLAGIQTGVRGLRTATDRAYAVEVLVMLSTLLVALRTRGLAREVAGLALFQFAATFVAVMGVYPLWRGANACRLFMPGLPAALLALAVGLHERRRSWAWLAGGLIGAFMIAFTIDLHRSFTRQRGGSFDAKRALAAHIRRHACGSPLRFVVAPGAFRYGWEDYPVTVILSSEYDPEPEMDLERLVELDKVVPLDVIALPAPRRADMKRLIRAGAFRRSYRQAESGGEGGMAIFVDARRPVCVSAPPDPS
jgi:4-amino-4-deoxy-L-arabinose transferase-like glycosyltransferase